MLRSCSIGTLSVALPRQLETASTTSAINNSKCNSVFQIASVSANYICFGRGDLSNVIASRAFLHSSTATTSIIIESSSDKTMEGPRREGRSRKPKTKSIESLAEAEGSDTPIVDSASDTNSASIYNDLAVSSNRQ